ncbi:MAG TPA: hypothetical protein DCP28_15255, partial [Cytophagales bacterium]|nr:hypothetical protein [Cytophagales bacterium]
MLKKTSPLLLLWTLLALACTSTPEKPSPAQIAAARQEVKDMLASIAEPVQKFTVSGESVEIIQGKHGTTVYVDPDFLETVDGSPLGERIQVELLELTSVEQMLLHNAQTVSDGQLLETGGAYHLQMSSGGRALQIKPGEQRAVQFPRLT